ncbi:MAG: hypothetical protein BGN87_20640 [Rhizobiales bacterium 65-79]|mgnify:CR=1 FL=1|jgi:hypothetical protein|nr:hypothetical protein [Hyphomicrobiales bacterium]OJU04403.1 MAG: hypothetical protein BGN87_20640 [Rhizobiales bacterium 65-79]
MSGRSVPIALGVIALVILTIAAWYDTRDAAGAWLFAFVLVAGVPIGALSLRLVGRLTGGAWYSVLEPILSGLSLLVPFAGIGAILVLASAPLLYPWASSGAHDASVGLFYLNMPLVVLKTVIAFAGWSVLALDLLPSEGERGQIVAGLGLVFHAVITTFVAYDWLLAMTPGFTSSAFGAETVIVWMLSALAVATILAPEVPRKASYDIAGLTTAMIMGVGYMVFFQFLIIWYGDLPDTVRFYLARADAPGIVLMVASLLVGLVVPMLALAFEPVRRSPRRLRVVALLVLAGIALYRGWCVLPLFGPLAWLLAPVATILFVCVLAVSRRWSRRLPYGSEEVGHG